MLSPYWQAILEDGSMVEEEQLGSHLELFKKSLRVKMFALIDRETKRILVVVKLDRNKRLIYRKRPELKGGKDTGRTIWVVGWQQTLEKFRDERGNPANIQSVTVLYWNGAVVVQDRFGGDGAYPIEPFQTELDAGMIDPRTMRSSTELEE
jgi:hypothetical protein